jgi:two-component system chemotaxis sensor kinase CheA
LGGARDARYAALFAAESRALLDAAHRALGTWSEAADAATTTAALAAVFRAVHSLKGMAAAMSLGGAESLAHELETALARARDGSLAPTPSRVEALVDGVDALDRAIEQAESGIDADVSADVARLRAALGSAAGEIDAVVASLPRETLIALPGCVVVRITIAPGTMLPGVRATLVLKRLAPLGAIEAVSPRADELLGESFDGRFDVRLRTEAPPDVIAEAAHAAGDVAEVHVDVPDVDVPDVASLAPVPNAGPARHVRVERERLDALMDVAGELALARGRLAASVPPNADAALTAALADLTRVVGLLHEEVRAARMAPAQEVFERLPRVVRDVGRAVGKRADLTIEGSEVALDRAVLEELSEPLVHLLRNAVDHGLESAAERVAAGKPAIGRIVLRAERDRDFVLVSVTDDGGGIDRRRVLERAGVGDEDALTDDAKLLSVLARPGLSTAAHVTSVSGRGVGVDAVRERLRAIGGSLELWTERGTGTRFTLRVPLTLALGRALVARVGPDSYALPVSGVRETAEFTRDDVYVREGGEFVTVRGEPMPLLRLAAALGVASDPVSASLHGTDVELFEAAVIEAGGRRAAFVVDAIDGQQDLVVKPLPPVRGTFRIFGGVTILEDGTPALVIDAPALLHRSLA